MCNCPTIKAPVFLSQIADNGTWTVSPSIPRTTNGPKQHSVPGTAAWLSTPTRSVSIQRLSVTGNYKDFIIINFCNYDHGLAQCFPNLSWRTPSPAYFVCLPYLTQLIQLISSLVQTARHESGVLDKRDIQNVQGSGPPGQVWEAQV